MALRYLCCGITFDWSRYPIDSFSIGSLAISVRPLSHNLHPDGLNRHERGGIQVRSIGERGTGVG